MNSYPSDLLPIIKSYCASKNKKKHIQPPPLPDEAVIANLLDISYHASFETDEGRRPGFRLILYSPSDFEKDKRKEDEENRFRVILLEKERNLNVAEVIRLAPAAELTRFLMCIKIEQNKNEPPSLFIWALLDMGENWWKFVHHETSMGMPPPNFLTISSTGPGEISISAQGDIFASLQGGRITLPTSNALWEGPLSVFLSKAQEQLYKDITIRLGEKKYDPDGHDDDYPMRFYSFFLERILFCTRLRNHGGTIICVPDYLSIDDTRLTDRLNIKYPCIYDNAWELLVSSLVNDRKYFDLHFPLWDAKIPFTQELYQKIHLLGSERDELKEVMGDVAETIASLTSVDGAVLINDHFKVLGFGAEVIAHSPSLSEVQLVSEDDKSVPLSVESFGTRHRSAFRFCSSYEDSVAFVVSQDGGVKAVKREGKNVLLWPNINAGSMGI